MVLNSLKTWLKAGCTVMIQCLHNYDTIKYQILPAMDYEAGMFICILVAGECYYKTDLNKLTNTLPRGPDFQ
jgi:hypothetical protein